MEQNPVPLQITIIVRSNDSNHCDFFNRIKKSSNKIKTKEKVSKMNTYSVEHDLLPGGGFQGADTSLADEGHYSYRLVR